MSRDLAILIGIFLAGYLLFELWAARELRRMHALRAGTLGDPPNHELPLTTGSAQRSPSSVTPPARGGGSPNARVYSWGEDPELWLQLFREELEALPEAEEPAR